MMLGDATTRRFGGGSKVTKVDTSGDISASSLGPATGAVGLKGASQSAEATGEPENRIGPKKVGDGIGYGSSIVMGPSG